MVSYTIKNLVLATSKNNRIIKNPPPKNDTKFKLKILGEKLRRECTNREIGVEFMTFLWKVESI